MGNTIPVDEGAVGGHAPRNSGVASLASPKPQHRRFLRFAAASLVRHEKPAKTFGRKAASYRKILVLFAMALLALWVLALSWPRFLASVRYQPVDTALARYYADNEIPSDRLLVLIRFANEAIGIHDHYRFHDGLSQLHYLRGLDPQTAARERRDAYRQAEAEAVSSLTQAPAQPGAWLQLATVRWILRDEPERVIEPWKMSIFTGRTHSSLYSRRVEMGLAHRAFLDAESVAMLRDQLLLAWRARPGVLAQVLARRDPQLSVTRGLLEASDPAALNEMEAWLEKLR